MRQERIVIALLLALFLLTSVTSFACYSHGECDYPAKCFKTDPASMEGTCMVVTDSMGSVQYAPNVGQSGLSSGHTCNSDFDCGFNGQCFKRSGAIYGICVK